MVIVKLYGGLGNQMFQYAAGEALSLKLGSNVYLDTAWFEEIKDNENATQRIYELNQFGIQPRRLKLIDSLGRLFHPAKTFSEQGFNYQKGVEDISGNVILDGYWQSYKYFEDYQNEVINAFSFPSVISEQNKKLLEQIESSDSVSVHVRRGDYMNLARTKFIGLLPIRYYEETLGRILEKVKNPMLYVFSDDLGWCKDKLRLNSKMMFVDNNGSDNGIEDLRLMSACKHNIIANSSFSWWGAWLNQNPGKMVCAPKKWFQQAGANVDDRLPKDWARI